MAPVIDCYKIISLIIGGITVELLYIQLLYCRWF